MGQTSAVVAVFKDAHTFVAMVGDAQLWPESQRGLPRAARGEQKGSMGGEEEEDNGAQRGGDAEDNNEAHFHPSEGPQPRSGGTYTVCRTGSTELDSPSDHSSRSPGLLLAFCSKCRRSAQDRSVWT